MLLLRQDMATKICRGCNQHIVGMNYGYGGATYCAACFQKLQDRLAHDEGDRKLLYDTIRRIFNVTEIPDEVVAAVNREVKAGRKLTGLTATLRYYYDLEGHVPGGVYSAIPVFREQYENARNYARKMAQIAERNQNIDLDVPPTIVTVTPESLRPIRQRPTINIEDL